MRPMSRVCWQQIKSDKRHQIMCGTWVLRLNGCPFPASLKGQQGVGAATQSVRQAYLLTPARRQTKFFNFCRIISGTKSLHRICLRMPLPCCPPHFQLPATSTFVAPRENEIMNVRWHNRTPDTKARRSAPLTWHRLASLPPSRHLPLLPVTPTMRVCAHFSVKVS